MTDKEAYDLASAELEKIAAFVDRPRCINCDRLNDGVCDEFGDVPESFWHKPNDCKAWLLKLPF